MKKILSLFIFAILIISLFSCAENKEIISETYMPGETYLPNDTITLKEDTKQKPEITGIPDLLVLERVTIPADEKYTICHNYDKSSYTDEVILETVYSGTFGSRITKYGYVFSYDEATDEWSQLSGKDLLSEEIKFNEEVFSNYGHFTGRFSMYESGTYDITVEKLDFENKIAKIKYCLTFDRDSEQISGEKQVEIVKGNSSDRWAIIIKYNRSVVVQFDQAFVLDMDKGLYAYE